MPDYIDEVFGLGGALAARFPGYQPREGQVALARAVDNAIRTSTHLLAEAPTGCHAAGQGLLMFDGSIKKVEDVVVGDRLMGPDSEPRTVLSLARGRQEMVDVVPVKGSAWRVNLDHILTLVRTNEGLTNRRSGRLNGQLCDVCVREVLGWSKNQRHIHKLIRVGVNFVDSVSFTLSPYFLGLVLGDGALAFAGTGHGISISSADPEIVVEIEETARSFDLHVRHDDRYGHFIVGRIGNKNHPIVAELKRLGLAPIACENRFIPLQYKSASRQARLELLAGLIDTDGSRDLNSGTCFDYVSKSRRLADDVAYVARSLGLAAYVKSSMKSCQGMNAPREYFRVCISGDTSIVPCRLPRKRTPEREQIKDVLRTGFDLVPTGKEEDYFGFSIDRDGRYLLDDFTVTHNTGKSVAYSVPAIYHATHDNAEKKAVIIVTANIALQEQLVRKDLPLLAEILPWPFTYALLKGKNNYLCLDRLHNGAPGKVDDEDLELNRQITEWALETETGDVSELSFEPPARLWGRFAVSTDDCAGKDCEFYGQCHSERARKAAAKANVVVTNYHLFFADMHVRQVTGNMVSLLPPYSVAILDEGHKAVDIARDFFGFRVTAAMMRRVGSMLPNDEQLELERAQEEFFTRLSLYAKSDNYKSRIKTQNAVPSERIIAALKGAEKAYGAMLEPLLRRFEDTSSDERKRIKQLGSRMERAIELRENIEHAMRMYALPERPWRPHPEAPAGDSPATRWYWSDPLLGGTNAVASEAQLATADDVFFIEEERGKVALCSKPISVARLLKERLFSLGGSVSVTSATLVARNSFEYIARDLGVDHPSTLMAPSPFSWREQALLVIPPDVPEPNHSSFVLEAARRCAQTIELARGRTLALFTSYKNLNAAHDLARRTGYRVLRQGDMPRTKLIDEFRRDRDSVLLGTESFWAGVDVPGESLSCVFIDKLPFTTPDDPVLDALTECDRDWFMKYSVPRAIIAFKQGFGRLIRTSTDRGVVVCLDKRLTTKFYGRFFLDSLPPVQRSKNIDDVRRFLDGEPLLINPSTDGNGYVVPAGRSLLDA